MFIFYFKKVYEIISFIPFFFSFSQDDYPSTADKSKLPVSVTNFNTYGYIDGKRLDSVEATYANITLRAYGEVAFDYGQTRKRKEYVITNYKRISLTFPNQSISFILNFFHYNHWDITNTYNLSGVANWIMKKQ